MFKTLEGQARYFAAYEKTLALWSVPVASFDIPTGYGPTHVHICGPEAAPPLVLLHGSAVSSTMWYPNIGAFSRNYRVYVPDIIGELGKSVRTRPISRPKDYVTWLTDLLDGLGLEQTHIAGLSFGGYIAMNLACNAPGRIIRLILMSPAGLLRIRLRFYLRLTTAVFVPMVSSRFTPQAILGMSSSLLDPVISQMMSSPSDYRYKMFFPHRLKDEELKRIKAPTLLLLGDREIIYAPEAARTRAKRMIPTIETFLIPKAGHALNFDQPEIVNQHVLTFLQKDDLSFL